MLLTVNSVLSWIEENEISKYRILWIDEKHEFTFLMKLSSNKWPIMKEVDDIIDAIKRQSCSIIDDPTSKVIKDEELSSIELEVREKAWEIILFICNNIKESNIFISKERISIINRSSHIYNVSESSIKRYLKKYWNNGMCKNGLLPNYAICGCNNDRNINSKLGRPKGYSELIGKGINIDENIKRIFRIAVDKYYFSKKKNSLKTVYELMIKDYFSSEHKVESGKDITVLRAYNQLPTLGQFKYWYQKERNLKSELVYREGFKKYDLQSRAVLGSSLSEAIGPGSIYQIDATIADVFLVSRYNRTWIIGRPIVYFVMDVFSKAIVALHIGLEGPSWAGMAMALANAGMDKVKFCKEYNIDITEDEWPMYHLPESIIGDRGELEGKNIESVILGLNISIKNTSSYRGDLKGLVERLFRTTNDKIKPFVPGYIEKDYRERGAKDYRLDAQLDIYEFTQIIIRTVLYHNNSEILTNYTRDELMIEDDVKCIPIELWNWGIKNRAGKLRSIDEEILKLYLMPEDVANVTYRGLKFKNMYYTSDVAIREGWFEKARYKGVWKITVSYDSRNMNYIYMKINKGKEFVKFYLLGHQERYNDKTLEEIEYLIASERLNKKVNYKNELDAKIEMMSQIEEIVNNAVADTKRNSTYECSKKKRLNGIRDNRVVEKVMMQKNDAFVLMDDRLIDNQYRNSTEVAKKNNDIDILAELQRRRLNGK